MYLCTINFCIFSIILFIILSLFPIRLGNHNILQCVVLFAIQLSIVLVGF